MPRHIACLSLTIMDTSLSNLMSSVAKSKCCLLSSGSLKEHLVKWLVFSWVRCRQTENASGIMPTPWYPAASHHPKIFLSSQWTSSGIILHRVMKVGVTLKKEKWKRKTVGCLGNICNCNLKIGNTRCSGNTENQKLWNVTSDMFIVFACLSHFPLP